MAVAPLAAKNAAAVEVLQSCRAISTWHLRSAHLRDAADAVGRVVTEVRVRAAAGAGTGAGTENGAGARVGAEHRESLQGYVFGGQSRQTPVVVRTGLSFKEGGYGSTVWESSIGLGAALAAAPGLVRGKVRSPARGSPRAQVCYASLCAGQKY